MSATIFDGISQASLHEGLLRDRVSLLGIRPRLLSIVFYEDPASQLYTRLKQEAAVRVGIEFDQINVAFTDPLELMQEKIRHASQRTDIHGLMIQKPSKRIWQECTGIVHREAFERWWELLVSCIDPIKDVDCLTEISLQKVRSGTWELLPATVKGVITVLGIATSQIDAKSGVTVKRFNLNLDDTTAVVIGRSRIVGEPLAAVLEQFGAKVRRCDSKTIDLTQYTSTADIICSATGRPDLITANDIKTGAIIIDIGSPAGDIDFNGVKDKAAFITPVPNGVGPMTVVSLLENLIEIISPN